MCVCTLGAGLLWTAGSRGCILEDFGSYICFLCPLFPLFPNSITKLNLHLGQLRANYGRVEVHDPIPLQLAPCMANLTHLGLDLAIRDTAAIVGGLNPDTLTSLILDFGMGNLSVDEFDAMLTRKPLPNVATLTVLITVNDDVGPWLVVISGHFPNLERLTLTDWYDRYVSMP